MILTYYKYPCSHAVLENVFARELGKICNIYFLFQKKKGKKIKVSRWHNSYIIFTNKFERDKGLLKLLNKILCGSYIFITIYFILKNKVDIIFVRDLPLFAILLGPLRYFKKFKLYFQYSAPQGAINISYGRSVKGPQRYRHLIKGFLFNVLIRRALNLADVVFSISEFHKKQLLDENVIGTIEPITMGVESCWVESAPKNNAPIFNLAYNNKIITYFGSLSLARNPKFIIKSFIKVKESYRNVRLVLVGKATNSYEEKQLKEYAKGLGIENDVIFTGRVNRQLVKDYIAASYVTISAIPPGGHFRFSSPTKLYESLGCGVPVVANIEICEQEKVIRESESGLAVRYDVCAFSAAILKLLNNPILVRQMSERARDYIREYYTYEKIAERLIPYFS